MTTPTIRDLCAALSGDVDYLIACIRDGSSDSCALQECLDRANAARDALAAEPVGEGKGPSVAEIDAAWLATWNPKANCYDVAVFAHSILARWGRSATPPAPVVVPVAGEVGEFIAQLKRYAEYGTPIGLIPFVVTQAATLLQQQEAELAALRPAAPAAPEVVSQPYKLPEPGEVGRLAAELRHFVAEYKKMRGLDPEGIYSIQEGVQGREAHLRVSQLTRIATLLEHLSAPAPPNWRGPMTDPTPADRLALALCPDRSSGARCEAPCDSCRRDSAAVIRELADQVVPEEQGEFQQFTNEAIRLNRMGIRAEILARVTELNGHHG